MVMVLLCFKPVCPLLKTTSVDRPAASTKFKERIPSTGSYQIPSKDFETSAHSEGSLGTYRISLRSSSHIKETDL